MIIPHVKNIRSWFYLVILSSLVVIGLVTCSLPEPVAEVKLGNLLIEYPGVNATGLLYWSPDDTTLLWHGYLARTGFTMSPLYLTDTRTLKTREIDVEGKELFDYLRMSGDGDSLYYPASEKYCWHRYSLTTGEDAMLLCDVPVDELYLSPDNVHLAYNLSDGGVYLYNLTTQQTRFLTEGFLYSGGLTTQLFSPDGSQFLALVPNKLDTQTLEVAIITVVTGTVKPLTLDLEENQYLQALHWTPEGILMLFTELTSYDLTWKYSVRNLTTGQTQIIWQDSNYRAQLVANDFWDWSGDGHMLGFTTSKCVRESSDCSFWSCSCSFAQYLLNTRDLTTGKLSVVAKYGYRASLSGYYLTFSLNHDGTKIAYYTAYTAIDDITRIYLDKIPE